MDDLTKEELEQLLAVFRDQALGILEEMVQDLLSLEADEGDAEAMARLRRGAHTIKGDAACIGLERVTELAHRIEDIIDDAASGGLKFEPTLVNVLLDGLDEMRDAIGGNEVEDIPATALEKMLDALAALQSSKLDSAGVHEAARSIQVLKTPQAPDRIRFGEYQLALLSQSAASGLIAYVVASSREWSEPDVMDLLEGTDMTLLSALDGGHAAHFLIAGRLAPDEMFRHLQGKPGAQGVTLKKVEPDGDSEVKLIQVEGKPAAPKKSERRGPEYVRVEAARIDALLNLAGEMVIARSVMNQVGPDLERAFPKNELVTRFSGASMQMGKLIAELQKGVLKMRMVTIDHVFRRFSRPMRELAAERGKLVELEISGGDTELDRTLVDLIYEPLLHLLRNAVDHGLEPPEEREALGKPRTGKINMGAYHEGNQVVVEVGDDGRGIDLNGLRSKAVQAGKVSEDEAGRMSDDEAIELMFLEGLSTAKEITLVSGRGVGGAAVKSVIEQLRGGISVRSDPGSGTTFILRMPLTLAIIKALLFGVKGQLFALPLLAVSEVAMAEPADIVELDGFESFRLRDRFISVVRPGLALGFETPAQIKTKEGEFFLIVVSIGGRRFGIAADNLIGEQEVVIKPLDSEWLQNEALAGASVLGDGRVVLILDAGSMLRKAIKYERNKNNNRLVA
jgi:two-component system chemotaxis sensor kinase CheA